MNYCFNTDKITCHSTDLTEPPRVDMFSDENSMSPSIATTSQETVLFDAVLHLIHFVYTQLI